MKNLTLFGLAALFVLVAAWSAAPAYANVTLQCPPDVDGEDTDGDGDPDNDNVCIDLSAGDGFVNMADGALLYMFGFSDVTGIDPSMIMMEGMLAGNAPAPTIVLREGQRLFINLVNVGMMMRPDLFDAHSVHFHGFPQAAPIFDGVPEASATINMGFSFTYFYNILEPGTYLYHCHVEATEHMQMGMIGNLYVLPKQSNGPPINFGGRNYTQFAYNDGDGSTGYDVEYPLQFAGFDTAFHEAQITIQPLPMAFLSDTYALINGRGYPDTINPNPLPNTYDGHVSQPVSALVTATKGQRILLRLSNVSVTDFFTVSALGLPMQVVATGAKLLRSTSGENLYYLTNSVTLGGGEATDVIIDTANVPAGTYVLYTTNLNFLSNDQEDFGGLMTEIVISPPAAAAKKGGAR
jgi:FtsP/CotA-like multicopper oxidase with cupredoxin domain